MRKKDATDEIERLKNRLKVAEDVVSYLVIWGAAPTDILAELVKRSMTLRVRDAGKTFNFIALYLLTESLHNETVKTL